MTQKDKAIELYNKMYDYSLFEEEAKRCALIAVDEIIDELTSRDILSGFWYEVHLELKKL